MSARTWKASAKRWRDSALRHMRRLVDAEDRITAARRDERLRLERLLDGLCTCPCCGVIWEHVLRVSPPRTMNDAELERARRAAREVFEAST